MQPKNDGGPFHPCECECLDGGRIDGIQTGPSRFIHPGASLRDHFAGLAMQALLSPNHPWGGYPEKEIPRVAWEMADAMLAERERGR